MCSKISKIQERVLKFRNICFTFGRAPHILTYLTKRISKYIQ